MLGVIIGTGTIIGVSAILTGFDASVAAVLRSFGPNSIIVFKFPVGSAYQPSQPRGAHPQGPDLPERASTSASAASRVEDVSAMLFPNHGPINAHYKGNDMYDVNLFGVEEAYARGGQVDIHLGRFFTDEESRRRMPVAVIGAGYREGPLRQRGSDRQDRSWWTGTSSR